MASLFQRGWVGRALRPSVLSENRLPKSEGDRLALAQRIGADGQNVLTACFQAPDLDWLRELPAIRVFQRIWLQTSFFEEDGQLCWRETGNLPPATVFINQDFDPDAHRGKKGTPLWTGEKVHLTETRFSQRFPTSSPMLPPPLPPEPMKR